MYKPKTDWQLTENGVPNWEKYLTKEAKNK